MEYLLAHDVGTSGCKAVLMTIEGRVVATANETYPTYFSRLLWAEQEPEDWWRALTIATRTVLDLGGVKPEQVLSLSFSTQMVNLLPLDGDGRPLRPCINWLDGRAWEEAKAAMAKFGGPWMFTRLFGTVITGKDMIPKYIWLQRNEPDVYRRSAAFVDVSGYLLLRATGRLAYEWGSASVTGLFSLKTKTWDKTAMRIFGLDAEKFPELVQSAERVGGLTRQAAGELGLLEGTPVFAGSGDAMCAAIGSGAVKDGEGHLCLGTSGFIGIITSKQVTGRHGIASLQSADPHKFLLIAETETAGACLKWAAKELFGREPDAETMAMMDKEVAETAAGAGKLIFTPWMYGERCPVPDECLRASFINLSSKHTRQQMTRAIYEGVAYNLRWMLESICELNGLAPDPLRVTGGGAKGLPWLRIISDITGRTLESVPHLQSASAVGAGLLAAVGLGLYPSIEYLKELVPVEHVVSPETDTKPVYDSMYTAYRKVYPSLKDLHKFLNQAEEVEA
jgi:xylulokinase